MPIIIAQYKEIISSKMKHGTACIICHNRFDKNDPILGFQKLLDDNNTIIHLSCLMKGIKHRFPDYWKEFVLEMI